MDNRQSLKSILVFVCVLLIVFPVYFSVANSRHAHYLFNADFLQLALFSKALFADSHAFEYWYITPSPYIFPDILLFGVSDALIDNIRITYVLFLLLNFVFFNLALNRLYSLFFEKNRVVPILFSVFILVLYVSSGVDGFLYINQYAPVNHLSAFIFFCFLLKKEIHWNWKLIPWLLCIIAISFSDPVFIIYFIPVQLFFSLKKSNFWLRLIPLTISLIGFFLFKYSYSSLTLKAVNAVAVDFTLYNESFKNLWADLMFLASSHSFMVWLVFIALSLGFIFSGIKNKFSLLYIIFIVPLIMTAAGFILGHDTFRYFTGSLFFGFWVGFAFVLRLADKYIRKVNFSHRYTVIVSFTLMIIVYAYVLFNGVLSIKTPEHILCMESQVRKLKVDYIIVDYWNAKPLLFFTDGFTVLQFDKNVRPYPHEYNERYYEAVRGRKDLRGLVYSANIDRDSLNTYMDPMIEGIPCGQDSLFVLYKNPLE